TLSYLLFFLSHPLPSRFYTLSLHDALPISPVDGSAIAGETGTRSRGRSLANVRSRAPSDRALPASTRMSARRREARIGMSESDSTPPANTTSALPVAIASAASATAWPPEAQARFSE